MDTKKIFKYLLSKESQITIGVAFISIGLPYLLQNSILKPPIIFFSYLILVVLGWVLVALAGNRK